MRKKHIFIIVILTVVLSSCTKDDKVNTIWLIGDSTVTNYALEENYQANRHPLMGWGQVFDRFVVKDSLLLISHLVKADSIFVDDRAKGGRSTRTFFQEGRWRAVYEEIKQGDLVLVQFGHNDAAEYKPARYVNIEGYKEFLRLYVSQTREKGGIPILITPVARNYPWKEGRLENVHGAYPEAMESVAGELSVPLIDLNQLSMDAFSEKGKEYVTQKYFMNLPAGVYEAYPEGKNDNTHFQPEGALVVAQLVFEALKEIKVNTL